jgi:hypothetical protein
MSEAPVFPLRITKLIRKQTLRVPNEIQITSDQIQSFDFKRMRPHYLFLRDILMVLGMKFDYLAWESRGGGQNFVAWVGEPQDPKLIWSKTAGDIPGIGANVVYHKHMIDAEPLTVSSIDRFKRTGDPGYSHRNLFIKWASEIQPCSLRRAVLFSELTDHQVNYIMTRYGVDLLEDLV